MSATTSGIRGRLLLAAIVLIAGCEPGDFGPLLDIPILPIGKTRSPPFRIYSGHAYYMNFGFDPIKADEATCFAGPQPGLEHEPCKLQVPAITWTVLRGSRIIKQGSQDATQVILPKDPPPWAKDKKTMRWFEYGTWVGQPGNDYVVEINVQPSPVDLAKFQPRISITKVIK